MSSASLSSNSSTPSDYEEGWRSVLPYSTEWNLDVAMRSPSSSPIRTRRRSGSGAAPFALGPRWSGLSGGSSDRRAARDDRDEARGERRGVAGMMVRAGSRFGSRRESEGGRFLSRRREEVKVEREERQGESGGSVQEDEWERFCGEKTKGGIRNWVGRWVN